jgi:type IV pilus assembly protein PilQ
MIIGRQVFLASLGCILLTARAVAQETVPAVPAQEVQSAPQVEQVQPAETQTAIAQDSVSSENVTLDFKEADIRNVLKIIALKAGVNIVSTPEVMGNVTIRLVDVAWDRALDAILKTNGFGYDRQGNIIIVAPIEKLTAQKKQEVELAQVQPTLTEVFALKYLDAQDAKKALETQLSPRGKITILEMTGQAGWEFGGESLGKRKRASEGKMGRSKVLIISDISPALEKIRDVVNQIDVKPQQIYIETKIMEVSKDKLRDLGIDFGTGQNGASESNISSLPYKERLGATVAQVGGHSLSNQIKPAGFGARAAGIAGISPFNTGLEILYQKLTGNEFSVMLHALEEDVRTNTLSSPRIMALNNQEATILVGTRYPILKQDTTSSSSSATVTTVSLDYYQDIGIQLNVVPQVGAGDNINLILHPAVTSFTQTLGGDDNIAQFPIIDTREAETRILIRDGETVAIGGLLKDAKIKNRQGIPFLSNIPILGLMFSRDTTDTEKLDLLVFITARIIKDGEFSEEEIAKLQQTYLPEPKKEAKKKK